MVQPGTVPARRAPPACLGPPGASCSFSPGSKLLGQWFSDEGTLAEEYRRRVSSASFAFFRYKDVLLDRKRRSLRTRGHIYQVYVLPHLLFGAAETWVPSARQLQGLAAVHNSFLRRMGGFARGPGCISNADLFRVTGVKDLGQHLRQLRLRRLGHVARMPDSSICKQLLFASSLLGVPSMAVRGRPARTWGDLALEDVDAMPGVARSTWYGLAQLRSQWRSRCDAL